MPRVPEYQQTVSARPILQQNLAPNATPEAMGAGVGRGMQQLGAGMNDLASSLQAVKDLEDRAIAKEGVNEFMRRKDELFYDPQTGYMHQTGRNALEGREAVSQKMSQLRKEYVAKLSPEQARMFNNAVDAIEIDSKRTMMVHAGGELKRYIVDQSNAAAQNFAHEALRNVGNPAQSDKYLAAALMEIRTTAGQQGASPEVIDQMEREFLSKTRYNAAMILAADNPLKAQEYFKKYENQFAVEETQKFKEAIKIPLLNHKVTGHLSNIFGARRGKVAVPRGAASVRGEGSLPTDRTGTPAPGNAVEKPVGPTRAAAGLTPTTAKQHLQSISNKDASHIQGLDDNFATNLSAMIADAPFKGLGVYSGYRSVEHQGRLWRDALKKYGSPERARKHVAPPGNSNHNYGNAVDLSYNGKSLKHAPQEVKDWVRKNAPSYGMHIRMSWEPWHIEPLKKGKGGGNFSTDNPVQSSGFNASSPIEITGEVRGITGMVSTRAEMPSYEEITSYLDSIEDPVERDLTRKAINAEIETRNQAFVQQQKAMTQQAFNLIETEGMNPLQLPPEITTSIGMEGMTSLMNYWEKKQKGVEIETDPTLMYNMRLMAAEAPSEFSNLDLTQLFDKLSKADRDELTKLQTSILADPEKGKKDAVAIGTAMSIARNQLDAVGITGTGAKPGSKQAAEAARREALFQNQLVEQMRLFEAENGRHANQFEIQRMINQLLLPVIIGKQAAPQDPSFLPNPFSAGKGLFDTIFGSGTRDGFLFEMGGGEEGESAVVPYDKIPPAERAEIERSLTEQGLTPTPDQVERIYAAYMLETLAPE